MSAFMVNGRTLTKIAKYMAACGNYEIGKAPGLSEIELRPEFKKKLAEEGLVERGTGKFSAPLIHAYLYSRNRHALIQCYGEKSAAEEMCPSELEPMEDGIEINTAKESRREWLSNLYTVSKCYKYQIEEGDYKEDEFYWLFREWVSQMADVLAGYVVREVRPFPPNPAYKPWDEF